jgi:hypothetical protein
MVIGVLTVMALLLGYAVLPADKSIFTTAAAVLYAAAAVAWWIRRRHLLRRASTWQVRAPGFVVRRVRGGDAYIRLVLAGGLLPMAAATGAMFHAHGWSDYLLPEPFFLYPACFAVGTLPMGALIAVTPAGLTLGRRLWPWDDVRQAYLHVNRIELRLRPRWIPWFGDRRFFINGNAYDVPAAEIHWLIQHYLLFPAERATMAALPTRAYALPA